ncbi:ABC transporter ATP-binding protein [Woodsholea maritima]|uniref:ABC transporter ATP-binding protein n=1 Tax=Woodsholea maritima TaxID=240237 RepID=UPI00036D7110|nr:ATP-binding cassette domain-containing protein [Woodsholea maritima]
MALEVSHLTKSFKGKAAVRDVSFTAPRGQITGFLGPNGAGKTTTLRMALGIIQPDSGQSLLFGKPLSMKTLDRVGFLPEERGLYRKMTALDALVFFGRLKGMKAKAAKTKALEYLERFELSDAAYKKVKTLSKGMAQKIQIIAALIHEPEFIILDEPFSGLDPVNQSLLESIIREEAQGGRTLLFSTHVMEHAERLCDRIVLLARGQKVFDGSVDEALGTVPRQILLESASAHDLSQLLSPFGTVESQDCAQEGHHAWRVTLNATSQVQDVLKACVSAGVDLIRFEPIRPHLHDAFVQLVKASPVPNSAAEPVEREEV